MTGHRIVVVEDDRTTRHTLRSLFVRLGFEVATASTISDGFCLMDPPPDYLMLSDGDGGDLLRWVRSTKLPTCVAVTTGLNAPDRLEAISDLKPDGLLIKPVDV